MRTHKRLDVRVDNHGSIVLLTPLTPAARRWVAEYLPEDVTRWAGGVVVEPRYLSPIWTGMVDAGLEVGQ